MTIVLKKFFLSVIAFLGVLWSGCYTEVATGDNDRSGYYAASDTTYDSSTVAINNNYYLNDEYRHSRFRVSFNYYYPAYRSSWIENYYYSYYDDWGWRNPYYGWYDCYPRPYVWDPWYAGAYYPLYPSPYYPPVVYYSGYPIKTYTPVNNGRIRSNGSSRDVPTIGDRSRPIPGAPVPGTAIATNSTSSSPRVRPAVPAPVQEAAPVRNRRDDEKPWWERVASEKARVRNDEARPLNNTPKPAVRNRRAAPGVNQPKNGNSGEAKPVERSRGRQGTFYSPPSQSKQPSYSPPSSGGRSRGNEGTGTRSSGGSGSGRKRD